MTIASAFNEIAVAQGGTAAKSGAITAAIDALNDALAGSDQPQAKTIEQPARLLGEHIGGGGGSSTAKLYVYAEDYTNVRILLGSDTYTASNMVDTTVSIEGQDVPIKALPVEVAAGEIFKNATPDTSSLMQVIGGTVPGDVECGQFCCMPRYDTILVCTPVG